MEKKDKSNRFRNFLKSFSILSGSGGIIGVILAASGICIPCVLIPLGFIGAGIAFVFSFFTAYKWWLISIAVIMLIIGLIARKYAVCPIKSKISKSSLSQLNSWKFYTFIIIVILISLTQITFELALNKEGKTVNQQIPTENNIFEGSANAKVVIVDFFDYYCPPCSMLYIKTLKPFIQKHNKEVKVVLYPVSILDNRGEAAIKAAYCAKEQGHFFDMHEKMLARTEILWDKPKNMESFGQFFGILDEGTQEYFTKLFSEFPKVDVEKFKDCMNSDKYRTEIDEAHKTYKSLSLYSVPVLIINGKYYEGYMSEERLESIVEPLLK